MSANSPFPTLDRQELLLSLDQRLQLAYERGLAEGRAEGDKQGQQTARQQLTQEMEARCQQQTEQRVEQLQQQYQQQLDSLLNGVKQQLSLQQQQLSEQLFDSLAAISQLVIEAELAIQPESYLAAIQKVLTCLQGREAISAIHVATADGEWLQTQNISQIGGVEVRVDDSLPCGQVQFDGDNQLHQLSFQQRLDEVLAQIKPMLMPHAD
ncbi:FliH/SctL family protein [Shewanella sp.]|uniref:FliH/SctL family protein n=1 Tax=Shewanella sp. TaxID=50422 RepID=UPI003A96A6CC